MVVNDVAYYCQAEAGASLASGKIGLKKFLPIILCLTMASMASAQDSAAFRKHYLKMYTQAINYNDINAAINISRAPVMVPIVGLKNSRDKRLFGQGLLQAPALFAGGS